MIDRILLAGFIIAVGLVGLGYGVAAGIFGLPPAPSAQALYAETHNAWAHWRNDVGLEPTRHLVKAYPNRRERFVVAAPQRIGNYQLLVAGLTPGRSALNSAILYDSQGRELHVWPVDYTKLDPEGLPPQNVFLHGLAVLEDGSLIVNFDQGNVLARVGPCGEVRWTRTGNFHHVVSRSHDGTLWTWLGDGVAQVTPEDGEVLQRIDLVDDIMKPHDLESLLAIRTEENADEMEFSPDPFHGNHVEVLAPAIADAFPMFEAGDLLISLRNLNLVAVVDPNRHTLKWYRIGPWHRQHQPLFQPDGSISVYDNHMSFPPSRILKIYPGSGRVETLFAGSEAAPFYSWRRGKHQLLANGDLLITESERGRAFIATPKGELVWEYNNIYDDTRNGVLNKVIALPAGYFQSGVLECDGRLPSETNP